MKLDKHDFERLYKFIKDNYGINLEKKSSLIEGRLGTIIQKKGFTNFSDYVDYVLSTPDEIPMLISRLSTNYTYFMREEQHYNFMLETALPEWTPRIKDKDLRIWSAGCSSGEEAYTAAMVLNDYFSKQSAKWDTTVLATDISEKVLELARKGIYPEEEMKNLSDRFKKQYFTPVEPGVFQLTPDIRRQVVFGNLNLMERRFPFKKKFHIIFCRNVMIYFDTKTRERLSNHFYEWLMPGGYLFIGMSETMSNLETPFEYVKPAIYKKPLNAR